LGMPGQQQQLLLLQQQHAPQNATVTAEQQKAGSPELGRLLPCAACS
jgi:hypothetical protein